MPFITTTAAGGLGLIYTVGSNKLNTATSGASAFTTPGTYSFVCPDGVYSVSVVCVGAGGPGANFAGDVTYNGKGGGGGGGGLGWKNNIAVIPGSVYTVEVGAGVVTLNQPDPEQPGDGGDSYFISKDIVAGFGGKGGAPILGGAGGGYKGTGGGNGGKGGDGRTSFVGGGGGAGGYTGDGGRGGENSGLPPLSGAGGGGGGGDFALIVPGPFSAPAGGGGVGITGKGGNGRPGDYGAYPHPIAATGGSFGANPSGLTAGAYGGGGQGGAGNWGTISAGGAVRIIWAGPDNPIRKFPNTNTS